jgi:hypothetical protein
MDTTHFENVQSYIFENSEKFTNEVYVELMDKLQIDYNNRNKKEVIIINRSVSSQIVMKKKDMIKYLITESIAWNDKKIRINCWNNNRREHERVLFCFPADRELFIQKLISELCVNSIKDIFRQIGKGYMIPNPRWKHIPPEIEILRRTYI